MTRTVVCTLVIGTRYQRLFQRCVLLGLEAYCRRHSYSLRIFEKPFVSLPGKSFAWQKLFILDQVEIQTFDRVLWIDSDIVVKSDAPPLATPAGLIGYVTDSLPDQTAREWYDQFDLTPTQEVVQTGVLYLEPLHRDVLHQAIEYPETSMYEMPALSRVLSSSNMGYHLDPRFNAVIHNLLLEQIPGWILRNKALKELLWLAHYRPLRQQLRTICDQNWFLHAAGAKRDLLKVSGLVTSRE